MGFDQSNRLLLDRPVFGVCMENTFRVLVADRIVTEDETHLIAAFGDDRAGREGGLAVAVRVMAGDAVRRVVITDPCLADDVGYVDDALAVFRHHTHGGTGPVEDFDHGVRIVGEREGGPSGGLVHRQQFAAALVVVVGEHRAADARQRGVASEEVSGEAVHEVEQMAEGVAVHMHRRVVGVHADAVLVEVAVGRELPEP